MNKQIDIDAIVKIITQNIDYLLNYKVDDADSAFIKYVAKSVIQNILNDINNNELPQELITVVVNRSIGIFIGENIGKLLKDDEIRPVKSIKEGDTTVDFGGKTKADVLNDLAMHLKEYGRRDVSCFRKIRW